VQTEVERLVHEGLSLAQTMARRYQQRLGGVIAADELLAIAQPVLFEAARTHDASLAPFAPYLAMKLKWAMIDETRKLRGRRKVARRAAAVAALERIAEHDTEEAKASANAPLRTEEEYQSDLTVFLAKRAAAMVAGMIGADDSVEDEDQDTPEEGLAREQLRRDLLHAVEGLPDRQRTLVERHYFGGERFDVIAADLGISKSWASRVHAQAMETLANALGDRH
jgi:RNA polymerase sigma factor for flagellar operon FliA